MWCCIDADVFIGGSVVHTTSLRFQNNCRDEANARKPELVRRQEPLYC